jgi:hypothetical protein
VILRVTGGDERGEVTAVEPHVLDRFHVEVGDEMGEAELAGAVERCGMTWRDGHVFVTPEVVVGLVGEAATPEWRAGFDRMVEYARSKGWTDATGALQAHVERTSGPTGG